MSVSRTNRNLVEQLRIGLDIVATQVALDQGEITQIQARNIVKWAVGVQRIQENPMHVVTDAEGQYIGELVTANKGLSWIGLRYGKKYPNDSSEFSDVEQAAALVRGNVRADSSSAVIGHTNVNGIQSAENMITKEEARRLAFISVASLVQNADFDELFPDDVLDAAIGDRQAEAVLDEAKRFVTAQLFKLAGK